MVEIQIAPVDKRLRIHLSILWQMPPVAKLPCVSLYHELGTQQNYYGPELTNPIPQLLHWYLHLRYSTAPSK